MTTKEVFSNRWGIILASLGMAIGAGNLWRFPRLAGQYGGTFIILWVFFLVIWSIPLMMAEFSIGKKYKLGVIGSFGQLAGKRMVWGGYFITLCTLGIAFYYAVVTGWALKYLGFSLLEAFDGIIGKPTLAEKLSENPEYLNDYWNHSANGNPITIFLYLTSICLGLFILTKGIKNGLEKANRLLIPSLLILLVLIATLALSMKNGYRGLEYMFHVDIDQFSNPTIWVEALSQSAWSTGAGWGLLMTLSSYSRKKEDVVLNTFISGFGNNSASLIAGMAILPAVFGLSASESEAIQFLQSGNQALTFTIIPALFSSFTGGAALSCLFFLAFFTAAFSSLLPMLELFISNLNDLGLARKKAALTAGVFCILFGLPSAYSLEIFNNQDWVWGLGLIISGSLIVLAVLLYGVYRFKKDFILQDSDLNISKHYFALTISLNIFLGIAILYWWMSQGYAQFPWFDENGNWNVWDTYSNATIVTQWLLVILSGILLNSFLYKKFIVKQLPTS